MSTPRWSASAPASTRMRELSTHDPMCRTGGMPNASQTPRRPGPACSAAAGIIWPALPLAMAAHPVTTTSTSFSMSRWVRATCP